MAGKPDRIAETKRRLEQRFAAPKPKVEADPWDEEEASSLDELHPRVSLSLGITLSMSNYRSARVDVGLSIDRLPDKSTDETFDWLEEVLLDKLDHAMSTLQEHME